MWIHWEKYRGEGRLRKSHHKWWNSVLFWHIRQFNSSDMWTKHQSRYLSNTSSHWLLGPILPPTTDFASVRLYLLSLFFQFPSFFSFFVLIPILFIIKMLMLMLIILEESILSKWNVKIKSGKSNLYSSFVVDVKRHNARVIRLEYEGEGPIKQTLMLVGKVTADKRLIPVWKLYQALCVGNDFIGR